MRKKITKERREEGESENIEVLKLRILFRSFKPF